jgi:hypothetical protein
MESVSIVCTIIPDYMQMLGAVGRRTTVGCLPDSTKSILIGYFACLRTAWRPRLARFWQLGSR